MPIDMNAPAYRWLARTLTGREAPCPGSEAEWQDILNCARSNGVTALLHNTLVNGPIGAPSRAWKAPDVPGWLDKALRSHTRALAALDLAQTHELQTILETWARNDIHTILLKGTPLAYSLYPKPWLRERCDTDVLFCSREEATKAHALLVEMGYQNPNTVSGDYISHQFMSSRSGAGGFPHTLDMHWRISNTWAFAAAVQYGELEATCTEVPALSPSARTLSHPHALLLACMHRVANHSLGLANRLIWLYDLHLLSAAMDNEEWKEFGRLAVEKNLSEISLDALQATAEMLGTELPGELLEKLQANTRRTAYNPLRAEHSWQIAWMKFRSLPGVKGKARYLREALFPPKDYMQAKYGSSTPMDYIRRIGSGIPKFIKRIG